MRTRRFAGPCVGLSLVGSLAACDPGLTREAGPRGTIELSACGPSSVDLRCGVLTVEENREAPNGRTIELAIAVAPARSRTPAGDPVFLIAGGPGQGAASIAHWVATPLERIRATRDIVFVDVRGTGRSGPLACVFEDPEDLGGLLGANINLDILDDCVAGYDGVDPSQYTSVSIVDDLDEVRAALGYEQVNLLGISYGTVVAQVWMQRHGQHIRSAVLDGAVPLDTSVSLESMANNEAALMRVLADCREQPSCEAAFPGLARKLELTLDDLDQNRALEELVHPKTGAPTRVDITRAGLTATLAGALYSSSTASLVPLTIERAHAGDYGPLAALALRGATMTSSISMGLYLSVACAEQFGGLDASKRAAAVAGLHVFDDHALAQFELACARWPHAPHPGSFEPLVSDTPTLLLSGAYDPVTPPAFGDHLAKTLTQARHVVVDQASHGLWNRGCTPRLIAEFFANPDPAGLDDSCMQTIPRPAPFLTANGPLPAPTPALDDSAVATEVRKLLR